MTRLRALTHFRNELVAKLEIQHWGTVPYPEALERQRALVEKRKSGVIPDQLILLEHPAVYTIGARKDAEKHLIWSTVKAADSGIDIVSTNRGGDITYHGPGQLVVYPIIDLSEKRDLHAYLRNLEEVLIRILGRFDLEGARREGLTGIWCEHRKIAALGVAVKSWITYHGFSLNVDPDLKHFSGIVPCGIAEDEGTVTSMRVELAEAPVWQAVEAAVVQCFMEVFECG
jgi:lipoate-protein ligase B|tara:strand:- start:1931 stop:2617 length:687 start_codon:yes stop_codon:yes gene_type:complete